MTVESRDAEPSTDPSTIAATVARLRATSDARRLHPVDRRRELLAALDRMLDVHEAELAEALALDLGKSGLESYLTDIGYVRNDIAYTLRHLERWTRPQRVRPSLLAMPARAEIIPQPLGVVLVIAPWNYAVHLALAPAVAAIAAGNCVVVKPSEHAPAASEAMARLIPRYLDPDAVAVVEGGVPETTELLDQRFDHIFFTGSCAVGHIVMEAAARHLTPVTLELGGKSPAIVDRTARIDVAARRIALGKFLNTGQTCVAPDYVLVDRSVSEPLVDELVKAIKSFYGAEPKRSKDLGRIVDDAHFRRLEKLLAGGTVAVGGDTDERERYIAPTVLVDVSPDEPVMAEEIFGPILPVLVVDSVDDAIEFVNGRDHPLALYVFTEEETVADRVIAQTVAGGSAVNTTVLHLSVPGLPFGGVGASGMGAYHGRTGFDTFSHRRGVLRKSSRFDSALTYPPFTKLKERIFRLFT